MITNTLLGLGTILGLMGYVSIKKQIKVVREENKAYWDSIECSTRVHANGVIRAIEEKGQFNENALGQLAENIKVVDIGINMIRKRDFTLGEDLGRLSTNTDKIKAAVSECMMCLEKQIGTSKEEISKTIKDESAKNLYLHIKAIK
ncbi:hypothetical protein [Clostridium sp.]|uniref:hypothetical protein n=1 Tax=Clostridium sp. TaxID=1506 RepID=UPI0032180D00